MLTASELVWLKRRQFFSDFYSSGCLTCSLNETLCDRTGCLLHPDLEDALEFSERVAAKLAKAFKEYVKHRNCVDFEVGMKCPGWEMCTADYKKRLPCDFAIMKGVQLEVEEEMNGEKDNS